MTLEKPPLQAYHHGIDTPQPADMWGLFRALRDAHTHYGLRSGQLHTLQAMLSVLKPGQGTVVFASNAELCRRIGGIDERTLRRHIKRFIDIGFIKRNDSSNQKRYRLKSSEGECLSFGLSLEPFFQRTQEVFQVAKNIQKDKRDRLFLRKKILTQLARIEECLGEVDYTVTLRKTLRRKQSLADYEALWLSIETEIKQMSTVVDTVETDVLPASNGQNVRHLSKSKVENIDVIANPDSEPPALGLLTAVCKEACTFSERPIRSWDDVESHARTLAPMMGIDLNRYQAATKKAGSWKTSSAIFILLEMGAKVKNYMAYFSKLTAGKGAPQFNPSQILNRMAQA